MSDATTSVARVTIGRLYNLGDYEHVRYEIAVDVGQDSDAGAVLSELDELLADLKPVQVDHWLKRRLKLVARADAGEDLDEHDLHNLAGAREAVSEHNAKLARRESAAQRLSELGGRSEHRDAKEDWDEE